jgi:hypothetical protein
MFDTWPTQSRMLVFSNWQMGFTYSETEQLTIFTQFKMKYSKWTTSGPQVDHNVYKKLPKGSRLANGIHVNKASHIKLGNFSHP